MASLFRRFYPILMELWIASVIFVFFVVRILGSNLGQRLFTFVRHRLGQ